MNRKVASRNKRGLCHDRWLAAPLFATVSFLAGASLFAGSACCQLPAQTPPRAPAAAATTQSLPAAQPTQSQPIRVAQSAIAPQAQRPHVEFAHDQLRIAAQNSSLNDILNEIARLTGLKITGGVADERVYGNYGPDSARAVLSELLDGTGTNMLLVETPRHTVAELILTPRNGGPTPPNPNAARESNDEENLPPGLGGRRRDLINGGRRPGMPNGEVRSVEPPQPYTLPQPSVPPPVPDNAPQPVVTPPDATQQSPNGVKTPREMTPDSPFNQQQQPPQ